jgi:hypothetical protein
LTTFIIRHINANIQHIFPKWRYFGEQQYQGIAAVYNPEKWDQGQRNPFSKLGGNDMKRNVGLFVVVAIALGLSLLVMGCGSKGGAAAKEAAAGGEFAFLPTDDFKPVSDYQVEFRGWAYKPEIPDRNTDLYNSNLDGNVNYETVTGDYPSILQSMMIAGSQVDVMYISNLTAPRFYDAGWIIPAEDFGNIDEIKSNMYQNVIDSNSYKGKLMGLSYFTSVVGNPLVNMKLAKELGLSFDEVSPASWDELWDSIPKWQAKGIKYPFLPWWTTEWPGINWGYAIEVTNRGGTIVDPVTHKPVLSVDGPEGETLRDWKRAWNSDSVPKEVLQYTEADQIQAFASGKYLICSQHLYEMKNYNDPEFSAFAGQCYQIPYQGQSWGMLDTCQYALVNGDKFGRSAEGTQDATTFIQWYGFKDQNGNMFVADQWVEESMLFSAYKPVMEDPKNIEIVKGYLAKEDPGSEYYELAEKQYDVIMEIYQTAPFPHPTFSVIWADEWNAWLNSYLKRFLTENIPVETAIAAMTDKLNDLNDTYGVK